MEICVRETGGVSVLDFTGNLDTNTSQEAQAKTNELLDQKTLKLLVNCEKLEYISSAGLRVLLATAKSIQTKAGELRICCLNEVAQEIFEITGFIDILNVFETEEQALTDF